MNNDKFEKWFPYFLYLVVFLVCGINTHYGWTFTWFQIIGLFGVWSYFTFKKIDKLISSQSDEHDGTYARTWVIFVFGWFMMLAHHELVKDIRDTSSQLERLNDAMYDSCYGTDKKFGKLMKGDSTAPCKTFDKFKISTPLSTELLAPSVMQW